MALRRLEPTRNPDTIDLQLTILQPSNLGRVYLSLYPSPADLALPADLTSLVPGFWTPGSLNWAGGTREAVTIMKSMFKEERDFPQLKQPVDNNHNCKNKLSHNIQPRKSIKKSKPTSSFFFLPVMLFLSGNMSGFNKVRIEMRMAARTGPT